ncbi:MAG TPA: patatin-like phospholipase family protein [Burkholderiaceae bacterium]|nr:patatin-like phospholipase family protein [Burkholderiaceae bacterium]
MGNAEGNEAVRPQALAARAGEDGFRPPGQIVLVLQGGGALGAYHAGVFEALHEAGIEPDWVIGTSIGAINAALIAGNPPARRLARLREFWRLVEWRDAFGFAAAVPSWLAGPFANFDTLVRGVSGFFDFNPYALFGVGAPLGLDHAAFYRTMPLRATLARLVDFDLLEHGPMRVTVGAVNARTGAMRYFDSRSETLTAEHMLASGALPPAFAAVRIDGEPYWDGGIYSNTPIEAVLDDNPRRSSTVFNVHLWNPNGSEPQSIWEVLGRQKEIQYSSRSDSHVNRQRQLHRLRHVINTLALHVPEDKRRDQAVRELLSWGCSTTIHVVRLLAPRLEGEDHTKDIDFTPRGIRERWTAGYADTQDAIARRPWLCEVDPLEGIVLHDHESKMGSDTNYEVRNGQ